MKYNPKWCEIEENLLPDQQASNRPDICARVFDIKKDELINRIEKKKCFGDTIGKLYVIEFLKCGLPHAHIFVILKQNCKINTPEQTDSYISAQIPDKNDNFVLHDIIMRHNVRGPYHNDLCLIDGKCLKHFLKPLQACRLHYRRRDTKSTFQP